MFNRKAIFALTFILSVGMLLAGCGTQAASEPATTQALPTQPVTASTKPVESVPTEAPAEAPNAAPTEAVAGVPAATVSFANDVMPIIESRCVNCHGGRRIEEGLLMRTYEEIMAGSENGPVLVPGDVANSKLVELVTNQKMPKRGPKLTPPQVQIITDWVAAGAPNN